MTHVTLGGTQSLGARGRPGAHTVEQGIVQLPLEVAQCPMHTKSERRRSGLLPQGAGRKQMVFWPGRERQDRR